MKDELTVAESNSVVKILREILQVVWFAQAW